MAAPEIGSAAPEVSSAAPKVSSTAPEIRKTPRDIQPGQRPLLVVEQAGAGGEVGALDSWTLRRFEGEAGGEVAEEVSLQAADDLPEVLQGVQLMVGGIDVHLGYSTLQYSTVYFCRAFLFLHEILLC